jgi:hypothetical protein
MIQQAALALLIIDLDKYIGNVQAWRYWEWRLCRTIMRSFGLSDIALSLQNRNCAPPVPEEQAATDMIGLPARALVMACSAVRPCRRLVASTEAAAA